MSPLLRKARPADLEAICAVDEIARQSAGRRDRIRQGIAGSEIFVASTRGLITGYVLLSRFFGHGFIELVCVHPRHRRCGLGSKLIGYVEARCSEPKLFTTTNESNFPMRRLLDKLGYSESGIIHNLDPGDPELVYFKHLGSRSVDP